MTINKYIRSSLLYIRHFRFVIFKKNMNSFIKRGFSRRPQIPILRLSRNPRYLFKIPTSREHEFCAVGMLQAILRVMLQGARPVGYCPKVLKGIISTGCCACYLRGVLFLDPRSWRCGLLGVAGTRPPIASSRDLFTSCGWVF
jgi:hypothetical protein